MVAEIKRKKWLIKKNPKMKKAKKERKEKQSLKVIKEKNRWSKIRSVNIQKRKKRKYNLKWKKSRDATRKKYREYKKWYKEERNSGKIKILQEGEVPNDNWPGTFYTLMIVLTLALGNQEQIIDFGFRGHGRG